MGFGCLKLLVALVLAEGVWSLPLGCQDNGASYKEGEVVQVGEPCLSCVCRRGALACSLRVCADYVDALPPGCFLVHKPNVCCPQLFCEGGYSPNGIELRTAVRTENKVDGKGCVINGTVYGKGSAVANWDPCEYCYCTEGGVKCVRPRCVRSFEGCKAVYEKFSCCPTHFDCRDAKVGFLMSRVKQFDIDSEPEKEEFKDRQSDQTTTPTEEKTTKATEDFEMATTEFGTEETTFNGQSETTTPSPPDYPTTLRLQTIEDGDSGKESTAVGPTEETTAAVTTYTLPRTEEGNEEASGVGSRSPMDVGEAVGGGWNSSEVAEDYDAYDYGEPKLPPSLPNLVIFPFVAADAVIKDNRAELYDGVQLERNDDQPVIFKDYFSPPKRTEGGFVPKQPPSETFYEFPFLRKELMQQPTESPTEREHAGPQIKTPQQANAPLQALNEAGSSFDGNQRLDVLSEDILSGNLRRVPVQAGPFSQVLQTEMGEFLLKGDPESFRKNQQTKKPVTVAYKNVVVDFYPDYLVTTTRSHSTMQSACLKATDVSCPLQQRNTTTALSLNTHPDSVFGIPDGVATSAPPKAEHLTERSQTSTPTEYSFFDQFLKSLTESNTPTVITFTASNRHKYSSKIKSRICTTAKPKREDAKISPTDLHPFSSTSSEGPTTTRRSQEGPRHSPTTLSPVPSVSENLSSLELENLTGHHSQRRPHDDPDRGPNRIHSNPGALLKLAGCNIYGMMYRIGKVITELSGPCVECLCTDLGVQCSPLEC